MHIVNRAFRMLPLAVLAVGCQSTFEGTYEDPNKIQVLDDRWNDTDARLTAETMIQSALQKAWLADFRTENGGKKPFVLVGDFENRTDEHIDTKAIFEAVRNELINSGKVRFLDGEQRSKLLKEYQYQGSGVVRKDQAKGPGDQYGADFFLFGAISSMKAGNDGRSRVTYQVEMRLTNIATSEIVFTEVKKITKNFKQARFGG